MVWAVAKPANRLSPSRLEIIMVFMASVLKPQVLQQGLAGTPFGCLIGASIPRQEGGSR